MSPAASASKVAPPIALPAAPTDPSTLDPLLTTFKADTSFHRCFDVSWGSREFYPGDAAHRGRFHPISSTATATSTGTVAVAVLYGASDVAGALSETIFHDVPVRGTKSVPHTKLVHRLVVELHPQRDLHLVDLISDGLRRLGLSRPELIESDARSYTDTAGWPQALHDHPAHVDGLLWVSRQHDTSRALVLFGDRVTRDDLRVAPGAVPLTLGSGRGLDRVYEAANRAGITITGLA